jgi:hypothetical protein
LVGPQPCASRVLGSALYFFSADFTHLRT